ncbi:MAG: UvrD-helicase domain-containing protein [Candidatus Falkowbacteria bacterium]
MNNLNQEPSSTKASPSAKATKDKSDGKQLNKEQRKAVEHTGNPLLIIAGAGTGKTTVITQKIGWLVEQELAKPDEILALTFTEKAAGEMQERVDKLMPYGYVDLWIMTFHGFCEKILKQHGLDIGLSTDFKLLNEFQQWALIKKNLDKFDLNYYRPMGNPTKFISALLKHFSKAKDENISPAEYIVYADELRENVDSMLSGGRIKNNKKQIANDKQIPNFNPEASGQIPNVTDASGEITKEIAEQEILRINEVANAYHVYQNLLLENSNLDFGDLINYTLKLFRERPAILAKYQKQFKHLLVDEFQDTNWAQYELVKLLKPTGENLIAVLDDDQSIYKFRGASISNVLQFKKDFSNAEETLLTQNYRSTQNILDLSYNFIQLNNPNRLECQLDKKIDKKLISNIKEEGVIEVIQGNNLQDEVNKVIEKIIELSAQGGKIQDKDSTWNDFAILVRANNSAKEFVNALEIVGLPYIFLASKGLYSKPVIMDIIAYLNLLDNYHESTALYRVLNIPVFKFEHEEILKIINLAKKKAWSIYEAVKYVANFTENLAIKARQVINLIIKHTALVKERKVSEIIQAFLKDSGYLKYLSEQEDQKTKETMRELNAFMKRIKEFESNHEEASVKNFLAELALEIESGEQGSLSVDPEAGPEMIKISTVHATKGLEFKYVFIVNMVDLRFPTTERHDPILLPDALVKEILPEGDIHLEEERRLFYVAMTRAKNSLYFSWAPDYGGTRRKKPSRFLTELGVKYQVLSVDDERENKKTIKQKNKADNIIKNPVYELPKYYSYSQLSSYKNCPYQYRFGSVLKIPTGGNANFSFGNTMHLTLQKFFGLVMQSQNAQQGDLFDTLTPDPSPKGRGEFSIDDLLKLYEESWIDEWYASKEEKEERRKKGREILKEFYNKYKDSWPKVIGLEQRFKLKLNDYIISGGIDRIDEAKGVGPPSPEASGFSEASVQIVDYKTGAPKQAGKITIDDKEQLLIYQMAAEDVLKKKVANLQFYYLDNNSEIDFLGTTDEKLNLQEKILDRIKEIETSIKTDNFPPKPSQLCKFCNFNNICEYRQM